MPTGISNDARLVCFHILPLGEIVLQVNTQKQNQNEKIHRVLKEILRNNQEINIFNAHFQN